MTTLIDVRDGAWNVSECSGDHGILAMTHYDGSWGGLFMHGLSRLPVDPNGWHNMGWSWVTDGNPRSLSYGYNAWCQLHEDGPYILRTSVGVDCFQEFVLLVQAGGSIVYYLATGSLNHCFWREEVERLAGISHEPVSVRRFEYTFEPDRPQE